jgi:two-component system NtrC family response regulator
LARHFAKELGKPLAPSAIHALQQYTWPGNVRELKSSVESAFVVAEGEAIDAADIRPRRIRPRSQSSSSTVQLEGKSLKEILREVFAHALRSSDGTIRGAALCLGLSKSKFYRNARELGVPFGGVAPQRAVKL